MVILFRHYFQIKMADQDKDKATYICLLGLYQFERIPQKNLWSACHIPEINGEGHRKHESAGSTCVNG